MSNSGFDHPIAKEDHLTTYDDLYKDLSSDEIELLGRLFLTKEEKAFVRSTWRVSFSDETAKLIRLMNRLAGKIIDDRLTFNRAIFLMVLLFMPTDGLARTVLIAAVSISLIGYYWKRFIWSSSTYILGLLKDKESTYIPLQSDSMKFLTKPALTPWTGLTGALIIGLTCAIIAQTTYDVTFYLCLALTGTYLVDLLLGILLFRHIRKLMKRPVEAK